MSGIIKNWLKIFQSKNASESAIDIAENKEFIIDNMRTLEVEFNGKHLFIIPDVYEKTNSGMCMADKLDLQTFFLQYQGESLLNSDDSLLFRKLVLSLLSDEYLEDLKAQIIEKQNLVQK